MAWTAVGTPLKLDIDWQYTEPVEGTFFRFKHEIPPVNAIYEIAQVEANEDGSYTLFDSQVLTVERDFLDTVKLVKPGSFTQRRLAIRRIPARPTFEQEIRRLLLPGYLQPNEDSPLAVARNRWQVQIESSDYIEPSAAVDLSPIQTKLDEISLKIDNLQTSGGSPGGSPSTGTTSGTSPLSIFGADLIGWYRADSLVEANNRISQWTDKSGKNNHATQSNQTLQPYLVSNGFNGKPTVRFNNLDVWFALPNILDANWGQASLFIVYNLKDNTQHWDATKTGATNDSYWGTNGVFGYNGYFGEFRNTRIDNQPANMTLPGQHYIEVISGLGTDSYKVFRDATNILTTNPNWGVTATPYIGRGADQKRMNGDISELFIVKRVATDSERNNCQQYIKSFWGMSF